MTVPPLIQLIHASDAPQHVAELKSILMRMRSENRISDLIVQDITLEPFSGSLRKENTGGIIVLLTHQVERSREEIEHSIMSFDLDMQKLRLIEIIVDNVPYNNHFISFPQDLKPVRSRDDMNLVWKGIEQDLQIIFPKVTIPEVEQPQERPADRRKYLKLFGLALLSAIFGTLVLYLVAPNLPEETVLISILFSFLLPIMIFLFEKKNLKLVTFPTKNEKRITGAINWKRLLMKTCIALAFFFIAFFGYGILLIVMGMIPGLLPPCLAMVTILLFLFYKGRRASADGENIRRSSMKRVLSFFGAMFF